MTAALNTCEALLLHMEGQARPIASAPPFTAVWYMGLQDSRYWRWALRAQQCCCCCCHGHTAAAITRESGIYGSSICFFPSDHMQLTSAGRAWGADGGAVLPASSGSRRQRPVVLSFSRHCFGLDGGKAGFIMFQASLFSLFSHKKWQHYRYRLIQCNIVSYVRLILVAHVCANNFLNSPAHLA